MWESKNTYIPSSPEENLQESIPRNIETWENIQAYGENIRTKQESIHVMERIETYASQHPDTCLNFTSPEMTRYFQTLQERGELTFSYLEENFSETQLQQFSYLISEEIITLDSCNHIYEEIEDYYYVFENNMTAIIKVEYIIPLWCNNLAEKLSTLPLSATDYITLIQKYPSHIYFTDIPHSLRIDENIIQIFAEYNADNTETPTFQFCDVPQEFFVNISIPEHMCKCLQLARNHTHVWDIFVQLSRHTSLNNPANIQALYTLFKNTEELQDDIYSKVRATLQDMTTIDTTPRPKITQENYQQYVQLFKETTDIAEIQILYEEIQKFSPHPELQLERFQKSEENYRKHSPERDSAWVNTWFLLQSMQIGWKQTYNSLHTIKEQESLKEISPEKSQRTLKQEGFDFNVSGDEKDKEWFQVKAKNGNILLAESLDGKKLALSGLWYRIEFDNNSIDMPYILSNNRTLSWMDRSCFGFFGNNTKDMIDITNEYRLLHNLPPITINTTTKTHTILSETDAQIIKDTFQGIWIVSWDTDILRGTPAMTSTVFQYKMQEVERNGHIFFNNGRFALDEFRRSLHRLSHTQHTTVS